MTVELSKREVHILQFAIGCLRAEVAPVHRNQNIKIAVANGTPPDEIPTSEEVDDLAARIVMFSAPRPPSPA
jgi:hypothetical protein